MRRIRCARIPKRRAATSTFVSNSSPTAERFTRSRKTPARALEGQLCFALYASANAMARAYAPLLAPFGLTYLQYLVLLVLWEGDELSVGGLGERLFLNSATLTPVLKRLEGTGLLKRRRGVDDEREVIVSLTARGRALERTMSDVPKAIFAKAALSETALVSLRTKLHGLRGNLSRDRALGGSRE